MNHTSEIQMFVIQSLELMQASFILSQCVMICQQDCTRDGGLTPICSIFKLDTIKLATLGIWSCISIRIQDQNVKFHIWKTEKKSTVIMWTVFVITVRQCLKQWDVTTTSVLAEKLVPP